MAIASEQEIRLFDSHCHLVSDDQENYPRDPGKFARPPGFPASKMLGAGVGGRPDGMHGPNPVNEKPTVEKLHKWMGELNVTAIAAVQKGMIYGTENSYIVDAASTYPDEMRAIIIIDPMEEKTLPMIRELAPRGIVGVRYFPINVVDKEAWLNDPRTAAVWELVAELGLAIDFEGPTSGGEVMMPFILEMSDRFPDTPVLLDHLYLPDVSKPEFGLDSSYDAFISRDNIYYKWTSLIMDVIREDGHAPEQVLRHAVDLLGADKLMWGSDIGTSSGTYHEMVERAINSTVLLTDTDRAKVLHDTGTKVLMEDIKIGAIS